MRREDVHHCARLASFDPFQSGLHFVTPLRLTPNDTAVAFAQSRLQSHVLLAVGQPGKIFQEFDPGQSSLSLELLPQIWSRCGTPKFHVGSLPRVLTKCKEIR